jgi:hypothetical protein
MDHNLLGRVSRVLHLFRGWRARVTRMLSQARGVGWMCPALRWQKTEPARMPPAAAEWNACTCVHPRRARAQHTPPLAAADAVAARRSTGGRRCRRQRQRFGAAALRCGAVEGGRPETPFWGQVKRSAFTRGFERSNSPDWCLDKGERGGEQHHAAGLKTARPTR